MGDDEFNNFNCESACLPACPPIVWTQGNLKAMEKLISLYNLSIYEHPSLSKSWHEGLLFKLSLAGIKGQLLDWFSDYLDNRFQRVVVPGAQSDWIGIKAGVPQGFILGPLLFLIYINDIVEDIGSIIRLFADDTSLYLMFDNPIDAANVLNSDLNKIHLKNAKTQAKKMACYL